MRYFIFTLVFTAIALNLNAQSILFNSSGGTPDASALIELRSNEKGFLAPRMEESDRLDIASPAQGLLVFQTNGTIGFYFYNGTGWDTLGGATTVTNINNIITNVSSSGIAVVRDEKAAGVNGGTFTSGDWRQRDLNTISGDLSFATLGTNSFLLDTGIYVISASSPGHRVNEHQIRLFNISDNVEEAVGTISASQTGNMTFSTIVFVLDVNTSTKEFIIEHQCTTTRSTDGFGLGAPWGRTAFTQVEIEKL